jgi:ubiquinone/menaquinone biosynthesis C-methylase UbiE
MKDSLLQEYSNRHVHFYDKEAPALLRLGLALTNRVIKKPSLVDLGCGDGRLIFALHQKAMLKNVGEVVGVDISGNRIRRLVEELPFVKGIVSDAANVTELPDAYFDFAICSQLIEHVEDDAALIVQIKRLLKNGGLAYISSVNKKWYGAYVYFRDGSFRLDPTHVREYKSMENLVGLIANNGFEVISVENRPVVFPFSDLIVRLFVRIGLMKPNVKFYGQNKALSEIRRLRIPVVGYESVEVLARKIE